jgi:hypothetical protein
MKLNLNKEQKELPSTGVGRGSFKQALLAPSSGEENKSNGTFTLTVELEEKKADGLQWTVKKTYGWNARGKANFRRDISCWLARELSAAEMQEFETDTELINKPVKVLIVHVQEGGKMVAKINGFLPADEQASGTGA